METWREKILLRFSDNPKDFWTVDDAMKGTSILGGTGSGKTSASGKALAKQFLKQGWGGLVLCAKTDEAELWEQYCKDTGRSKDLIMFRKDAVHQQGKYEGGLMVFNPLHYEMNREGAGAKEAQNITNIFMNIYRMGNRVSGEGEPKEERFWDTALKRCLNRIIEIINYAGEELTYKNMVNVIFSAVNITDKRINKVLDMLHNEANGIDYEEVEEDEEVEEEVTNDPENEDNEDKEDTDGEPKKVKAVKEEPPTKEKDYCLFCIAQALFNTRDKANNSLEVNTIELAYQYFSQTLPAMGEKTRTTITESFMGLAEPFLSGLLSVHFSGVTNIFPEQTYTEHKIIILDFSVKEFLDAGIMAQCIFKLIFQQAIERRDVKKYPTPVFLWADEAQYFVNPYDQIFLTTARSSRAATVFLSQNISNYLVIMGAGQEAKPKVDSFMGNLTTKIFHANSDAETNEYASRLIGQAITYMATKGSSSSFMSLSYQVSEGQNSQFLPQIQPREFTILKSGGSSNDFEVDSVVFVSGKLWSNNTNYYRAIFNQDFPK